MIDLVPDNWKPALATVLAAPEAQALDAFLRAEDAASKAVYPAREARFRALDLTPPDSVKVVVLGQDPYHGPGQAMGLAFSVPDGVKHPPSLRNIFSELESDVGVPRPASGDLTPWARQGVLLLNTALSVEQGKAGSHAGRGWEAVTDAVVDAVARGEAATVFVLWGSHAQAKAARIPALRSGRHLLIESPHPSPLSAYRGFFGSRPFSRANAFLEAQGRGTVDWRL
ncbi:uracil-DNA glycosylase [Aurantiacibacter luteus]|uniref:Uracil-DNA glycosylase n=1 Tax=Aurantiacibacter luteus TaxID=1581420 RepID=A0A0G9MU05_9SPHN|nr:uracil-DNA glycosylase [Aurantiacibacter luteus]KLE34215.1 uracil-DNA glycosylase [Aurantiacibacter luteus]